MRQAGWPALPGFPWLLPWLLCRLAACSLEEDVLPMDEDSCGSSACNFDEVFLDEQLPVSLLQKKATQIQGRRALSGEQSQAATGSAVGVPLDFGNLSQLDPKSRFYLFHTLLASVRERAQVAAFVGGVLILVALVTPTLLKHKRRDKVEVLQFRVDQFVTHTEKVVTAKREAPLKIPDASPETEPLDAVESVLPGESQEPAAVTRPKPPCAALTPSSTAAGCSREVSLAPLEPAFVLPLCETWYAVCVEPMAMCDGAFDIRRIAGYPLLHGTVRRQDGLRLLQITCSSMPTKQGQVLASAMMKASEPNCGVNNAEQILPSLEIMGLGDKHVGYMRPETDGSYILYCGSEKLMSLAAEDGRQLVLRSGEATKHIAQVSWFEQSDFFSGSGHLAVRINPNMDTILVLACALGLTILGGDKNLLHFTRPADRGAGC